MVLAHCGDRSESALSNAARLRARQRQAVECQCGTSRQSARRREMIITKRHIPRRTVLRGLGVTLALSLLDGMVPALTAQSRTAAAGVRRFAVGYPPNGMSIPYWYPKTLQEGPLHELPPTLQSLNPVKDSVLMCNGLNDHPALLVEVGG